VRFEFATATRILFGPGTLRELAPAAAALGQHALVVTGGSPERAAPLLALLDAAAVQPTTFGVASEPTVALVCEGLRRAREAGCDLVIGCGGGSAVDAGKAIAALLTNPGDPLDYLEVIGRGKALEQRAAPYIAIPTTAGTGAEVTRNAVLASPEHRVKVSLRSPLMLPVLAVVDPELTYDLPPAVTASTGLDALTQVIEPFVSVAANPLTDGFCREGMRRGRALRTAYQQPRNPDARCDMMLAALCGGLALANAKLGAVHGFAGVFGGMFDVPHGAVCAALLPPVMKVNLAALRARDRDSAALARYREVAQLLTGYEGATADDGADWLAALVQALGIPGLRSYGLTPGDYDALIEKAAASSSMKGNPITLETAELRGILDRAS